jgi:transposase
MFLRCNVRLKDGKEHRYWNIVENRRTTDRRVVQRQVLYLGEINDSQKAAWCKTIEAFDETQAQATQLAIFPEDRWPEVSEAEVVQVQLSALQICRPRQWGACWLACELWQQLDLESFWRPRLANSREGTCWRQVLQTMVAYRLIAPGSEWRLHRQWYEQSAMADLLGADFGLVQIDKLYRCHDRLLKYKKELFSFLKQRWQDLFNARFDVLLYDLTSTYFEGEVPDSGPRRFGYSRDKRSDCVQLVIALIVTPEGFPIAYEVLPGNTSDKTTLADFLKKIEQQYGRIRRTWVMDRGIPTEEVLADMRASTIPMAYVVGTPRGRLTQLEKQLLDLPWQTARGSVEVKLLAQEKEFYILTRSPGRRDKERAMRQRRLRKYWHRLKELQGLTPSRDELLLKLGAARHEAGRAAGLVKLKLPKKNQAVTPQTFTFTLLRKKLRAARRREGHYLLRAYDPEQTSPDPAVLWQAYIQLTAIEEVFKHLKSELGLRPNFHQREDRMEAHIFIAFMAYCLLVTLQARLRPLASGLTARAVLEKFAAQQMVDVHLPTTDGRYLILSRYTEPEPEQQILLRQLRLQLPPQPPPKIRAKEVPPR